MNETIQRFGYPATLIAEYAHWVVLLRPDQPTLGSLVLAARSEAQSFAALEPAAFAELARVTDDIEQALASTVRHEKLNYLMLMMVDPHVHFHVIPRYAGTRSAQDMTIEDKGWPKAPALGEALSLSPDQIEALSALLKQAWNR